MNDTVYQSIAAWFSLIFSGGIFSEVSKCSQYFGQLFSNLPSLFKFIFGFVFVCTIVLQFIKVVLDS